MVQRRPWHRGLDGSGIRRQRRSCQPGDAAGCPPLLTAPLHPLKHRRRHRLPPLSNFPSYK